MGISRELTELVVVVESVAGTGCEVEGTNVMDTLL